MKPRYITFGFVLAFLVLFLAFPFVNQCEEEDSRACTWSAAEHGNGSGWTFTDYYGLVLYWHHTE